MSNKNLSTEKMLLWQILFPRKENKAVDLWQILFLRPHSADGTLWAIGPYQGITNFHNNINDKTVPTYESMQRLKSYVYDTQALAGSWSSGMFKNIIPDFFGISKIL